MNSFQSVHAGPDVLVHNEGTVFLFHPLSAQATTWMDEHVQPDALWLGSALVVEYRYALDLAKGMKDSGLLLA